MYSRKLENIAGRNLRPKPKEKETLYGSGDSIILRKEYSIPSHICQTGYYQKGKKNSAGKNAQKGIPLLLEMKIGIATMESINTLGSHYTWNLEKQTTYLPPPSSHYREQIGCRQRQNKEWEESEIGKRGQNIQSSSYKINGSWDVVTAW